MIITERCPKCGGDMMKSRTCGVMVCFDCDHHKGLVRCYCGWSETLPGRGREELETLGETIEPEDS